MLISSAQTTKSNLQAFRKNTKDYFRNFLKKRESNPNTLKGSFSKNRITSLLLLLSAFGVQAATITSTATGGTWSTGSTWVGGVAPATGDTVIIATTGTGSVNITTSITQTAAGSVTVNNGAKLTMSSGTLVFGALTVSSGGTITIRRTTTILGATTITGRINFGATGTTARTITFTGAVTLNAGAVWDETNVGTNTIKDTYVIKNNFTNNAATFTALTGSAHNFTGTGTLSGSTTTAMPTATFTAAYTNNGVFTSATLLTVTGVTLTNNGTITASTALSGSGGVTQGTTGILNIGGASAITTLTATASGNTVNYTGAAQTVHTGNYSTLNFSGSGIKTLATGTTTIGSLSLSGTASTTTVVNMAISNTLTIADSVNGKCFVYPNPNSGMFQVRYHSVLNNVLPRGITVYNAKGERVLVQTYTIGRSYDRMDVDLRKFGKGLYWVEIVDTNGNRITMCRVVIH